jgi:tRNA(fMet)-specific endonuclease VapC
MGLVLDSGVLIAAERSAKPVSELLATLEQEHGETEVVLSSITVIELEHGLHRANTAELARKRRDYLDTVFASIAVEPFTKEMAQAAAKIDADAKQAGLVIPFADLLIRRYRPALRSCGRDSEPAPLPPILPGQLRW